MTKKEINKLIKNNYKKTKKIIINFKKIIIEFIKNNKLFLCYILLSLINCFFIRFFTVGNYKNIKTIYIDLSYILLLGNFVYLLKPEKRYKYLLIIIGIITFMCVLNSIYYGNYSSFASISLLTTLGQVAEVGDAVVDQLKLIHFIYIVPFILFIYINNILRKKNYFNSNKQRKNKKKFVYILIISLTILGINLLRVPHSYYGSLVKQWNKEGIVKNFGIIMYQGNDIVQSISSKMNSMFGYDEASRKFVEYYKNNQKEKSDNEYTDIYKNKNVIFFHLESMMTFFVDLEINGVEVTPTLNKLTKEGLYFNNFYPEPSVGTSSDTEFTSSTSLLPVTSGTVFVSYYDRTFPSIQHMLKDDGYFTFSMHGNKASMWNRHQMHPKLGYEKLYFEDVYDVDEIVGLGLSDESFFRQIVPILSKVEAENEKYMGYIITLSNHTPFADVEKYGEFDLTYKTTKENEDGEEEEIVFDYLEGTKLGNYIKSAHYADLALGKFIESIYENDIMNDTLFVMYGDHDAKLSKNEYNYYYNFDFTTGKIKEADDPTYIPYDYYENELNRKTPLIIWTKEDALAKEINYPMGMIDLMPTVSNMLGITPEYNLGNDIFETKEDNIVPFPNGNFLTNKVYYDAAKQEYVSLPNNPIDETYIEECKVYTENIIELSNDIIVYDLIEKEKDRINE